MWWQPATLTFTSTPYNVENLRQLLILFYVNVVLTYSKRKDTLRDRGGQTETDSVKLPERSGT